MGRWQGKRWSCRIRRWVGRCNEVTLALHTTSVRECPARTTAFTRPRRKDHSVPTQRIAEARPIAAVSSFGYSGTIGHQIMSGLPPTSFSASHTTRHETRTRLTRTKFPWDIAKTESSEQKAGVITAPSAQVWETTLNDRDFLFQRDHRIGQVPLLAGTSYMEMARTLGNTSDAKKVAVSGASFLSFLYLDESSPDMRVTLDASMVTIESRVAQLHRSGTREWTVHARMRRAPFKGGLGGTVRTPFAKRVIGGEEFYRAIGNNYQGEFRSVHECHQADHTLDVRVDVSSADTPLHLPRRHGWTPAFTRNPSEVRFQYRLHSSEGGAGLCVRRGWRGAVRVRANASFSDLRGHHARASDTTSVNATLMDARHSASERRGHKHHALAGRPYGVESSLSPVLRNAMVPVVSIHADEA